MDEEPTRVATVLRCRIPRTFIDCNRRIDASPEDFKAGKVTPGLMLVDYDRRPLELLRAAYDRYVATVRAAVAQRLEASGALLMLHTYAPRTVDVEVDHDIGPNLRRAYQPEVEPTWPLRPRMT